MSSLDEAVQPSGMLAREALELRRDIIDALYEANGGHYGGSLSVVDILLTLYRTQLRAHGPLRDPDRDRIILSKGHAAIALYAVLRKVGLTDAPLSRYASLGSPFEGHPDMTALPAVDFSTGSLGQGLAVGLGMAIALRGRGSRVWVVLGDGECQEGQVWETALLAARVEAENLVAVIDVNGFQEWGWNASAVPDPIPEIRRKWAAFGWGVLEVDGHDHDALVSAYAVASAAIGQPTVILAQTIKGKGVPLAERDPVRFHCTTVTDVEHAEMVRSLG
jgi:transketolase